LTYIGLVSCILRYLPTPSNIRVWKLERKMDNSIKRIISSRLQSKSDYGDDLLGILLKAYNTEGKERKMSIEEIIHECRTFFFGGHETTSNLLAWTTMLLSLHQDWQEKLREEIFKECGKEKTPDSETFSKLKLVMFIFFKGSLVRQCFLRLKKPVYFLQMNMVIMESLRLYGPVSALAREASVNIKLGDLEIPKGTTVVIPLLKMHSDKTLWGSDADKFNPMRFANGVSRAANHPNALLAFSVGPRACIGQNFVMIEAKTVLTMILQRFRFISLCDEYKHTPVDNVTIQPQYGLPVMLQPLED